MAFTNVIIRGFKAASKLIGQGYSLFSDSGEYVNQKVWTDENNYIVGSVVRILTKISVVEGSTVTLKDIYDPLGVVVASDKAMLFDYDDDSSVATYIFKSEEGVHITGRYKFVTKVVNGNRVNLEKGFFYLEEE